MGLSLTPDEQEELALGRRLEEIRRLARVEKDKELQAQIASTHRKEALREALYVLSAMSAERDWRGGISGATLAEAIRRVRGLGGKKEP